MKKAFSLIELLVVMGILVVLMSLGTFGLISFRASVEFNSAYTDLQSLIIGVRNDALNSRSYSPGVETPDYYFLILTGDYSIESCTINLGGSLTCTEQKDAVRYIKNAQINIQSDCNQIGFQRRTGRVYTTKNVSNGSENINCNLTVSHFNVPGSSKSIAVDTILNVINFE